MKAIIITLILLCFSTTAFADSYGISFEKGRSHVVIKCPYRTFRLQISTIDSIRLVNDILYIKAVGNDIIISPPYIIETE